jgi:hypothetical protein
MGGKAQRTNVAGGMSGSPVYYEGKLMGAISLRFSVFSPDATAGITPIEAMLEINEFDASRPFQVKQPSTVVEASGDGGDGQLVAQERTGLAEKIWSGLGAQLPADSYATPIETPLTFSGVRDGVLEVFDGYFRQAGIISMRGGAVSGVGGSGATSAGSLQPGEPIAAVLISGDMSATGLGTVTANDGKRVLAFGHSMFNLGPVEMPMAGAEVLTVLASKFSPVKIANSGQVLGALRQDRHSGIMGVLGDSPEMIPVRVKVRTFADGSQLVGEKELNYKVFQNQKWTPPLIVLTLYNSMFGLNDFAEEVTFRLNGQIDLGGDQRISLDTMQTSTDTPIPAPLLLAGRVGDKLQQVFRNNAELPKLKQVDVTIDLLPERRTAEIEYAWLERTEVRPGEEIQGKVYLRPYRGERIEKSFAIRIPEAAPRGALQLMFSDASLLNRTAMMAAARNNLMDLSETVTLINKEFSNDQLFISLLQPAVTAHLDGKTLPNVPLSVLHVMRRTADRRMTLEQQSPLAQIAIPFGSVVSGRYTIPIRVK